MSKLLTLGNPLVQSRTLLWLQDQASIPHLSRWDAVITRMVDYDTWYERNARIVGMVAMEDDLDRLYELSKEIPLILISDRIWALKSDDYWEHNYDNLLVLDTLHEQYPFLKEWDGSVEDAVGMLACLLRYQRLISDIPIASPRLPTIREAVPPSTVLVTQLFSSVEERNEEMKECLRMNCASEYVDRIVLLQEKDMSSVWHKMKGSHKIRQIVTGKRLTYAHFLQYVHDEVPANTYAILANADIYMDPTLSELWKIDLTDKVLALLRWNADHAGDSVLFGPRADSQDTWIFLSDSIHQKSLPYATFDFPLGRAGCDNAFAAHLLRNRFSLFNPCLSIKTNHLHVSEHRTWTKADRIQSDLYINLVPSHLLTIRQETVPSIKQQCICHELVSFDIKSSSLSNELTYCAMLAKEGRYKWEASVENHYFEPAIPVYSYPHAGVTSTGLIFTPDMIVVGKQANEYPFWEGCTLDLLTPLIAVKTMLAIPFADTTVFLDWDRYVLEYLSRVARLLKEYPDAAFWVPPEFAERVLTFGLEGIPWSKEAACWAETAVGLLPGRLELGHEDIQALRELLPTWCRQPQGKRCVVLADHAVVEQVRPWLQERGWEVTDSAEDLIGASFCLLIGEGSRLWALPVDACVVEFQQELSLQGESQHLCHVADLKSWVLLLSKGSAHDVQCQIMEQLAKWYAKNAHEILVVGQ